MRPRRNAIVSMLLAVLVGGAICPPATAAQPNLSVGASPAVFVPEKVFEFSPVIDGVKVVHDFVVVNQGTAPLTIESVRTG